MVGFLQKRNRYMARFIEVPALGETAIANVDEISYIAPAGEAQCYVQFSKGAGLDVYVSMREIMRRMLNLRPIDKM